MRVFLVGEGPHDVGDLARHPSSRGGDPGFLQPIVARVIDQGVTFDGAKVSLMAKRRVKSRGPALRRQAELAAALAANAESELLVFIRDLDRGSGTGVQKAARDIKHMSDEIVRGCHASPHGDLPCVPGIPCRTIEAWALGDNAAVIAACAGVTAFELPDRKSPEELWGKRNDPNSNHPKMVFKRLLGRGATRSLLSAIAESADLEVVRRTCPVSFEPFLAKLEEAT